MIILSQTHGLDGYHGTLGNGTNMCDSDGNPLFVGDIVSMHHADYPDEKSVAFVCEEDHQYVNWTGTQQQYVPGISSIWNSEKFKQVTASIYDDAILEQINNLSYGWVVKKVKDFAELTIGERCGFLYVRNT